MWRSCCLLCYTETFQKMPDFTLFHSRKLSKPKQIKFTVAWSHLIAVLWAGALVREHVSFLRTIHYLLIRLSNIQTQYFFIKQYAPQDYLVRKHNSIINIQILGFQFKFKLQNMPIIFNSKIFPKAKSTVLPDSQSTCTITQQ